MKKIAIIGLGYVGLPLAVEFGKKRQVTGYDVNAERITELKSGKDMTGEVKESDLAEAVLLKLTDDPKDLEDPEIYIVTVPTPVDQDNRPDLRYLMRASEIVGQVVSDGNIVVFESTVFPGATEEVCAPIISQVSGLRFLSQSEEPTEDASIEGNDKRGFFCAYSPERINPGDKTRKLPEIVKITSGSTPEIAKEVDDLYSEIITAGTYPVTSIKVAEASKVIENSQRDLNIAFVNELSMIFDRMQIDTREVLTAAGTKWNFLPFEPGLVGGHCIGVDPYYLTHKAESLGYRPRVLLAGRMINDGMSKQIAEKMVRMMLSCGTSVAASTVGVLGLTFKENCPDTRNSKVFDLIKELNDWGVEVVVHEPHLAIGTVFTEHGIKTQELRAFQNLSGLVIAVAHDEYKELTTKQIRGFCSKNCKPVLIDIKAIYDKSDLEDEGFMVFRL